MLARPLCMDSTTPNIYSIKVINVLILMLIADLPASNFTDWTFAATIFVTTCKDDKGYYSEDLGIYLNL